MSRYIRTVTTQTRRPKVTVYNKAGYLYLNFMLDGKRKQKALKMKDTPANRKIVAKEIIPQIQAKIATGDYGIQKEAKKKFKFYSDIFLDEKEKTQRSFLNKLPFYLKITKFFNNYNVQDITRLDIKQYLATLNIQNSTKSKYLSVIRQILDLAIDDQEITTNPAVGIILPKEIKNTKIDYFTKDEVSILLNDKIDMELNVYLQIAFSTGMRAEEILALKKTDIKDGFVKIQRTKTRAHGISDLLKTVGSKRTIPFNVDISSLNSKSFFLFPNIAHVDSLRNRWKNLLKRNDIRHRGISNCRHTFATHCLKDEVVSISELSGLLGHSKVSTTLTFYASIIDSNNQVVSNKLQNLCYHSVTQNDNKVNLSFG